MFNNRTNREFQSGLKHDERRRSRQDHRISLRRADRENRLQKKRQKHHERRNFNGPNDNSSQNGDKQQKQKFLHANIQQLPQLVQGCYSDHPAAQFECTQRIRKLLSIEQQPPIQEVIHSGVATRLIQFLDFDNYQQLQFEAAWALTNIASGKAEETAIVVRYGAVPKFVKLMGSSSEEVKEQAVWALGNIAGDSPELRNLVLSHGAMDALLNICNVNQMQTQKQITLQRNVAWTLSNFCRGKPQPEWQYTAKAIRALGIMSMSEDEEILADVCWAFSYLSDITEDNSMLGDQSPIKAIYQSSALARLVGLLEHENPHVRHPALRSIGNVVTGDEEPTQWVVNLGVLKKLQSLLAGDRPPIKREACWTISNITAGSPEQIEAVVHANLIPMLINILKNEKYEVAKEALWALSNATSGGRDAQITFLVNQGIIGPLCSFLRTAKQHKCIMVTLEALENILRVGDNNKVNNNDPNKFATYVEEVGGAQILEDIQSDQSLPDSIFEKAGSLVRDYFDGQEEDYMNNNHQFNQREGPSNNMNMNNNNNNMNNNSNNWNAFGGGNNNNNSSGNTFGFGIGGNGFNNAWNGGNNMNNNSNNNNSAQHFQF